MYVSEQRMMCLAKRLGAETALSHVFKHNTLNTIENLVHEIGHALSLQVRPFAVPGDGLHAKMGLVVAGILERRRDKGVYNECLVLACEATVLPRLGIAVDIDELVNVGIDQGVKPAKLRKTLSSKAARKLASSVLRYLGRHDRMRTSASAAKGKVLP